MRVVLAVVRSTLRSLLVMFLRVVTRVFFRTVEVSGAARLPRQGPVIVVGNHPNSLLDPVLVTTTSPRPICFAAKEPLFRTPLRPMLWLAGSIPVKRRQDQSARALREGETADDVPRSVDNSEAFAAMTQALRRGDAFGIFPEGISHAGTGLAPLKTGAARIALAALDEGMVVPIVPCGLTYRRRTRMRGQVLVQFGAPLVVDRALRAQLPDDPIEAARALTERIDDALRAQTINAPDFETLRMIEAARQIYEPRGAPLSLAQQSEIQRRFTSVYEEHRDDPAMRALASGVDTYLMQLRALGLRDVDLHGDTTWWFRALILLRQMFFLLVLMPLAAPGVALLAPVLVAAVAAGETLTERTDVRATVKIAALTAGALALLVVVGGLAFVLAGGTHGDVSSALRAGVVAAGIVAALALSGFGAIRVLERGAEARRSFGATLTLVHLEHELERLCALRDSLRRELLALVDRFEDKATPRVVPLHRQVDAQPILDDADHADIA